MAALLLLFDLLISFCKNNNKAISVKKALHVSINENVTNLVRSLSLDKFKHNVKV